MGNMAIMILSHKEMCKAMLESVEMICSKHENVTAVTFYEDMDDAQLMNAIEKGLSEMDTADGILFLADLYGGTPFKTAYLCSKKYENSYVLSGFNLPMVLEAIMSRGFYNAKELYEKVRSSGLEGIRGTEELASEDDEEDE